jgi:ABC-type enterobactin transport system permease subunit
MSPFLQTLLAAGLGAIAPAMPALVMGDTHTFRIALSAAVGAVVTALALHFKSPTKGA